MINDTKKKENCLAKLLLDQKYKCSILFFSESQALKVVSLYLILMGKQDLKQNE